MDAAAVRSASREYAMAGRIGEGLADESAGDDGAALLLAAAAGLGGLFAAAADRVVCGRDGEAARSPPGGGFGPVTADYPRSHTWGIKVRCLSKTNARRFHGVRAPPNQHMTLANLWLLPTLASTDIYRSQHFAAFS
jgi:hypothetical protein